MDKLTSLVLRHKTTPKANTKPSFLSLPAEIRNLIYTFLFANIEEEVVIPITRTERGVREIIKREFLTPSSKRVPHLALLMTNRQIRAEAFGYVHGTVHAAFDLQDNIDWLYYQMRYGGLKYDLKQALRAVGEDLPFVTHLDIGGADTLRYLTHVQKDGIDGIDRAALKLSRDKNVRRGAKLSDRLVEVRNHLPNVRCLTVISEAFDKMPGYHSDILGPLILMLKTEPTGFKQVAKAFPLLKEIRLQGSLVGRRYRKEACCGQWSEWYGGEAVPFFDW